MFPVLCGICSNLVKREINQVHAIREHLTFSSFYFFQSANFQSTKNKAQCCSICPILRLLALFYVIYKKTIYKRTIPFYYSIRIFCKKVSKKVKKMKKIAYIIKLCLKIINFVKNIYESILEYFYEQIGYFHGISAGNHFYPFFTTIEYNSYLFMAYSSNFFY